jgi:hypothetical protein
MPTTDDRFLIDSSAWIEYLRATGSATNLLVRELIKNPDTIAVTEPIIMELLAGAPDITAQRKIERLVDGAALLTIDNRTDWRDAAAIHVAARRRGRTVRKLVDCLIASIAARTGAVLVHNDTDYDMIADSLGSLNVRRALPKQPHRR